VNWFGVVRCGKKPLSTYFIDDLHRVREDIGKAHGFDVH
jgi:hypothetical protein